MPRSWPGETVVILATGPSLTQADVDFCRGKARVIAINNAYQLCPWADCLYGTDAQWWSWHKGVPSYTGPKWSLNHSQWGPYRAKYTDVQLLMNTGPDGLEHKPTGLKHGRNSGYAAINLAVHYGAKKIVLLGYDMGPRGKQSHFFGDHPNKSNSPYAAFRRRFLSIVKPLKKIGVEVINCSRKSSLTAFPTARLEDVLAGEAVAA